MVDSSGLENRHSLEQRTIEGSNPSLSFLLVEYIFCLLVLPGQGHNERVVARLSHLAKPEKKRLDINKLKK